MIPCQPPPGRHDYIQTDGLLTDGLLTDGCLDWQQVQHVAPHISSVTIAHPRSEVQSIKGSLRVDIAPPDYLSIQLVLAPQRLTTASNALLYVQQHPPRQYEGLCQRCRRERRHACLVAPCSSTAHYRHQRRLCESWLSRSWSRTRSSSKWTTRPWCAFASRLPYNKLISQNPADWKSLGWFAKPGAIIGSDFAGTVAAIGPEAKVKWSIGDRVAGCNMGNFLPGRGAFAEYTRSRSDRLIAVPDALPLEQSATLGIPFYTAAQASRAPRSFANPQSRILLLTTRRSCSRPELTSPLSRSLEIHG